MGQKNIKNKIMEYFFENPSKKLRVRQIEKELKLPLPSVIRYTKELTRENFLEKQIISGVTFYKANTESEHYTMLKKLHNIRKIYESGLVKFLKAELFNPCIILFGSFARGEDTEESDIDIFVQTDKSLPEIEKFEKYLGKKLQVLAHSRITRIKNKHLRNNIINGITLNGFLEVY